MNSPCPSATIARFVTRNWKTMLIPGAILGLTLAYSNTAPYLHHERSFYAASFCGVVISALFLYLISRIEPSPYELKHQDLVIPAVYIFLYLCLIIYYSLEWHILGCYGPPNPIGNDIHKELVANRGWLDALYFSVVTSSTLGYGDLAPLTRGAKMLASVQALTSSIHVSAGLAILLTKRREPARP